MTIRFVAEAQREFLDAIVDYEDARSGLGQRFKNEVDRGILWIAEHPELSRLRSGSYRRINLRVFPYIPYIVRGQTLWILAIAHASRKPLYWIARRSEVGEG